MSELFLEFNDASMENMGYLNPGRIKLSDQNFVFKTTKSGRMEQIQANDIETCQWIRMAGKPAIRILTKSGVLYRFGGFKDLDFDKLKEFMAKHWDVSLEQIEMSVKGWNYGKTSFKGNSMEFEVENQPCFEIPLQNVSNCTTAKNEVAVEFHQNDECSVSLMEMRFHIPTTDTNQLEDPVEEFRKRIMQYAGIIQETGKALAVLDEILCSTPRGRYDIKLYPTFLALHGKTFDYKIPISTILRLFLLPHRDGRRIFFVVSLDPPIKQGQTRYHFLIMEFNKDEEIDLELGLPEDVLKEKYEGQLAKNMKGPLYEVVSRIMKTLVKKKISVPGNFVGHSGTPAVSCAFKSAAGLLYPLEKGFMFIHKPPIHVRHEELASVNFARSDVSTRTFDFEIETKTGSSYTFTSIEKEEYGKLFDYVNSKKLRIKNVGKKFEAATRDFFEGSDEEVETDHYAENLKKDAKEMEEESDEESEDSDYNPNKEKRASDEESSASQDSDDEDDEDGDDTDDNASDVSEKGSKKSQVKKTDEKKKHVENVKSKKSDDEDGTSAAESNTDVESDASSDHKSKKVKPKVEKKPKQQSSKRQKKEKDPNRPKKAATAYMLWLNENRDKIKKPGMSVVDVTRKAGEIWHEIKDKTKWEGLASQDKKRYAKEMEAYQASGGSSAFTKTSKTTSKKSSSSSQLKKITKTDEFVNSDDDSLSDDEKKIKKENKDEDESAHASTDSDD